MKTEDMSELLRLESRLLELRRATRSLEHRRVTLTSERERLSREIENLLQGMAERSAR